MRTSRVSRDTASVLAALTPRRSSRRAISTTVTPIKQESPLSDASLPSDDYSTTPEPSSNRKRKRPTGTYPTTSPKSLPSSVQPSAASSTAPIPKRARRQPAKQIKAEDGTVTVAPPANWEEMYSVAAAMRKLRTAPVDTMGCETLADTTRTPRDQRFQTLVALMLSSQTKDTVTAVAMQNLQRRLPGGFSLESVLAVEPATLNGMIDKVGFHNNKTKYIKATAEILRDRFAGDIPDSIEGLVSLPGVGPKMAFLTMSAAWGRDEGIGVDVHVHRITNLWGWHKTKNPEETRASLEAWLPKDKWHNINTLLVGLGQTYCPPVGRKCGECRLGVEGLCPSAVIDRKQIKAKREVKIEDEVKAEVEVKTDLTDTVGAGLVETQKSIIKKEETITSDLEDAGR
ncbi:hypothetical protein FH972_021789 [Carpinus fangiana]|uniref:Endonuclease III homolog n=1 Tax=Carpinus fangiana TaxID=176857 RepID=A0A5N6KQD1_9ROSI|nr:hypothetical protein FH972_021789 [Carpinus fangiana]